MSKLDEIREGISMLKCVEEDGRAREVLDILSLLADELERVDKAANFKEP